ncbi:hypothetical protein KO481_32760 [Nocardia sp. NEAU-G5]|uniref:Histidinol dehydrogenase n=1 Tax=Nocardia albiluteola TaxID=2842303 RepID=A0ABS6B7K6_9NOCA|nr:hypothetical protein [Nocardia albiluteola]MBU3066277.1 hypothetical protein [Nocardia albiluteola]
MASKFGEQFAKDAGDTAWHAVERLRKLVADKVRHDPEALEAQATVAHRITEAARADSRFANEVDALVSAARKDSSADIFIAQAFDDARQVNIHGDNTGTISIG